jgi:uncharacterized protein
LGSEFKYTDSPRITKSMYIARADFNLDHIGLVYPGISNFPLDEHTTAYGLDSIATGKFFKNLPHR